MSYLGPSLILTAVLHAYMQEIAQTIAVQRKLLLLASNCKFPAHKNSVKLLFGSWIIAQRVTTLYIAPLSFLGKLKCWKRNIIVVGRAVRATAAAPHEKCHQYSLKNSPCL